MKASDVQKQIDKLNREIVEHKSEIHDRQEAIKHLETIRDAMSEDDD